MSNTLRTALIILIATVWATNMLAPLIIKGYKPPAEINLAFMGVVGYMTASYSSSKKKKK